MTQQKKLVPSNSNLVRELERVATAIDKTPSKGAGRFDLLRRQAALGDLRDDLAKRAARAGDR